MHDNWQRLQIRVARFSIDQPGSALPFSARLAREQGWTLAFAAQAVEEYKRFMMLAVAAGHPVTPSVAVDAVWHLHLIYTRSYWHDWCHDVLEKEIHHEPTNGGEQEDGKFFDWYQRTLDSYRVLFGDDPPESIWPCPATRFAKGPSARWVIGNSHWILPRPRYLLQKILSLLLP